MGILGFCLGLVALGLFYWMFIIEKTYKKWYTCVLAICFIAFTIFALSFVITSALEGVPQAAMVALLLFGIPDIVLFILWKASPRLAGMIGDKSKQVAKEN